MLLWPGRAMHASTGRRWQARAHDPEYGVGGGQTQKGDPPFMGIPLLMVCWAPLEHLEGVSCYVSFFVGGGRGVPREKEGK